MGAEVNGTPGDFRDVSEGIAQRKQREIHIVSGNLRGSQELKRRFQWSLD